MKLFSFSLASETFSEGGERGEGQETTRCAKLSFLNILQIRVAGGHFKNIESNYLSYKTVTVLYFGFCKHVNLLLTAFWT